ncbi:site-specific integrase [Bradyrhizobium manausense]|uniref:site-specific integrase n=1 Tax=Bradyrhizobium manausense TaxID=989370 RepID=UPI001BAE1648|nr:site-specific integrase [Bradyrhizobium manausense]MBR0684409.1 site-specific integrase [Bradyrhizobium manausense]
MSKRNEAVNKARPDTQADRVNRLFNSTVAYASGARPGPNPLDARLVLRSPRPSIARKPGRRKKKQGVWYIVDGKHQRSTGCSENAHSNALDALALYKQEKSEQLRGAHMPGLLLFDEVLADYCAYLHNRGTKRVVKRAAEKARSMANTLLNVHFRGKLIGTYVENDSHKFWSELLKIRHDFYVSKGLDPEDENPEYYAHACLSLLRRAIASYPGRHGQFWCIAVHVPKRGPRRKAREWLRKYQLSRLLLACWGFQWDWAKGCWKTKPVQRPDGSWYESRKVADPDTALLRQGMSRLIRLIIRTGLRHEAVLLMKWGSWDNLGGIEFSDSDGNGWVHRRGTEEYNTPKSLKSTEIYEELKVLLRIWAKQDGYIDPVTGDVRKAGTKPFIIRDEEDKGYRGYALEEFRQVCDWAGLDDTTTVHALKTTAATWCKQRGYSDDSIAEMLDTSVETLKTFYIRFSRELKRSAREEFDDRAKRQKWRKIQHNEPDPTDPKRRRDQEPARRALPFKSIEEVA